MTCFFQKAPMLCLECDLNKPDCLMNLACRDALQDVFHMLKRCPSGECFMVEFNATYEKYLKNHDAPKALASAFMELQQNEVYLSALKDVRASYELCYPYLSLTAFFLGGAAVSAYIGTHVCLILTTLALCLAIAHILGYGQAFHDYKKQPSALDEKLEQIEAVLKKTFAFKEVSDDMETGLLLADEDNDGLEKSIEL